MVPEALNETVERRSDWKTGHFRESASGSDVAGRKDVEPTEAT